MQHKFLTESTACKSKPCRNGGKCINLKDNKFKCVCHKGSSGKRCENSKYFSPLKDEYYIKNNYVLYQVAS